MSSGGQGYGGGYSGNMSAAGAGGYNPQPMGQWSSGLQGVPQGWNMTLGSSPNWGTNYAQGQQSMPGAPAWLQKQMGDYYAQPFITDPNQYGRWNWGTNLQGQGTPSAFGQYAQQHAQYQPLTFPPLGGNGGGGGAPPPPAPPPNPGAPPPNSGPADYSRLSEGQRIQLAHSMDYNSPLYQQLVGQYGQSGLNDRLRQYSSDSNTFGQGDNTAQMRDWASQYAAATNMNLSPQARAYQASLLKGSPYEYLLK